MTIPYPTDPSLPSNPAPLFSDSTAARGDHLRANNAEIWANFTEIVETILGNASLSTDGTFAALSDLLFPSEKAVHTYIHSLLPVGSSIDFSGTVIPSGWMKEDGSSLLRASYPTLYSALTSTIGTCTISNATPAVVTLSSHPFITGDCIHFITDGSLPPPLSPNKGYYVIYVDDNTFRLATTYANALAGTAIDTSSAGSGTHTCIWSPWNIADSTHFYIPDMGGLSSEGSGQQAYTAWAGVNYTGRLGQYKQDQMQGHYHALNVRSAATHDQCVVGSTYSIDTSPSTPGVGALVLMSAENQARLMVNGGGGEPRTGTTTYGPRVGKYKIIKVI